MVLAEIAVETKQGYIDHEGGVHCWSVGCDKVVMKAMSGWLARPRLTIGRRCKCGSYNIVDFERIEHRIAN